MALYRCGSSGGTTFVANAFASGVSIPNCKKGDFIVVNIWEAYGTGISITNGVEITRTYWQEGAGSTWGFVLVIQVTADGTVGISSTGNGRIQKGYHSHIAQQ